MLLSWYVTSIISQRPLRGNTEPGDPNCRFETPHNQWVYIKDRYSVMDWPGGSILSSGGSISSFCIANWKTPHVVNYKLARIAPCNQSRRQYAALIDPPNEPIVFPRKVPVLPRGRQKKKSGTPVVGGWVRVRKRTRVRFIFSIFFLSCFWTPLIEKRPKTW